MLTREQGDLLLALVEVERSVPRERKGFFMWVSHLGSSGEALYVGNGGGPRKSLPAPGNDFDAVRIDGFIRASGKNNYNVTAEGFAEAERIMLSRGDGVERQEEELRRYLDSEGLRARYRDAVDCWVKAEDLLWKEDSDARQTEIGHYCREP